MTLQPRSSQPAIQAGFFIRGDPIPMRARATARCPLCSTAHPVARLSAATWLAPEVVSIVQEHYPSWHPNEGACPYCARLQLQRILTERALTPPHDPPAHGKLPAWECLPTPFRVSADPRFTGAGVTIAIIDAAFYPHPDLIRPRNRIRAWVDASGPKLQSKLFDPDEKPTWPGWDAIAVPQWHGLMASGIAAGNGRMSHGLYRGIASDADVILIQTMDHNRKITNTTLARALRWLIRYGAALGLKVVNFSVAGDPCEPLHANVVDRACATLIKRGVTLVAACGNSNKSLLVPPCSYGPVIAVGGLDDRDRLQPDFWRMWHSNFGHSTDGQVKPDLVAPSWRVVAPLLPKSSVAKEAKTLFARRLLGDHSAEARIDDQKLVTPYYQHMDGTSVAAPIVSSVVACMLQANPALSPERIRRILVKTAVPLPETAFTRQGAGAVHAGAAVAAALAERITIRGKVKRRHPTRRGRL